MLAMKSLLWALLFINIHCMSVQKKGGPEGILHQIEQLEKGSTDFATLRAAHADAKGAADFQFSVSDPDCLAEVTFVKEGSGTRVSSITFAFEKPTSLPALTAVFGKFRPSPPTPAGKWSAIAIHDTDNAQQSYAIIAEGRQKLTPTTAISKVTVRIDYAD
jgi:hypothetical protein